MKVVVKTIEVNKDFIFLNIYFYKTKKIKKNFDLEDIKRRYYSLFEILTKTKRKKNVGISIYINNKLFRKIFLYEPYNFSITDKNGLAKSLLKHPQEARRLLFETVKELNNKQFSFLKEYLIVTLRRL